MKPIKNTSLIFYKTEIDGKTEVPLIGRDITAGFPSPADDFLEYSINLNDALVKNPATTICARVVGNSMVEAGIENNNIIVIDRSLEPKNGDIAVCSIDNELTVKRIKKIKDKCWLMPENKEFKPIELIEGNTLVVFGIVKHIIKSL